MDERIAIGIDPGVKGGIIALVGNSCFYYPTKERYQIRNDVERLARAFKDHLIYACIEKVGGFIGDGEKNVASAHSTFVLGRGYGNLEMALVCARISFTEVPPKTWQKVYGMQRIKGEKKSKWKGRLYEKAKELFPEHEFNKELADAFLIAHYCRSLKTW